MTRRSLATFLKFADMSHDPSRNSHSPGANNGSRSPSYSPSWRGGDRRRNPPRQRAYGTPTDAEIDALGDQMRAINVSGGPSTAGLRKSTKDWSRDHDEKRRSKVQDMPLVSRGGWSQEDEGWVFRSKLLGTEIAHYELMTEQLTRPSSPSGYTIQSPRESSTSIFKIG